MDLSAASNKAFFQMEKTKQKARHFVTVNRYLIFLCNLSLKLKKEVKQLDYLTYICLTKEK